MEKVKELQEKLPKMVAGRKATKQRLAIKDPLAHAVQSLPDINRFTSPSPVGSRFVTGEDSELMIEALKLLKPKGKGSESA